MKEKLSLLRDEKSALEKAKQDEINGLKGALESKDKQLEDSRSWVLELEKACAVSSEAAARARDEVTRVEQL